MPEFQRWLVDSNLTELKESIGRVGVLRCPVICYVKDKKAYYIIDGNHLRTLIIGNKENKTTYKDKDEISCIYNEVENYQDAADMFKHLNTKGKNLDWLDITHLYMHTQGRYSVYGEIWTIIGKPKNHKDAKEKTIKGFSLPTIVEFLVGDKNKYRNGAAVKGPHFRERKMLLDYLMVHANHIWEEEFTEEARPSGAAILGFAKFWFSQGLFERYNDSDFLRIVNEIYTKNKKALNNRELVINRDNAAKHMEKYIKEQKVSA